MYKVSVFEKVLGQLTKNTYSFPKEDQMLLFKKICEEDGDLVIIHKKSVSIPLAV